MDRTLLQSRISLQPRHSENGFEADRSFLEQGTFPERKALIRKFVQGIEVVGDEITLTYTIPMPSDGVTREGAKVLDFVQCGGPKWTVPPTVFEMWLGGL